jgi:hypothetical protein
MAPVSIVQLPQRLVCWSDQRTDAGRSWPPKWRLERASARRTRSSSPGAGVSPPHEGVVARRRATPEALGHALDPFRLFLGRHPGGKPDLDPRSATACAHRPAAARGADYHDFFRHEIDGAQQRGTIRRPSIGFPRWLSSHRDRAVSVRPSAPRKPSK